MLTPEQQVMPLTGLTCTDGIILLQLIARMSANGSVKDEELTVIGTARDNLKNALVDVSGVDFDVERARQLQIMQEAQRHAKEADAQAKAQTDKESDEVKGAE